MTAIGLFDRLVELKAKNVLMTAPASYCGKMIIKLCEKENITIISLVRREESAELLRNDFNQKYVVNTSDADYKEKL